MHLKLKKMKAKARTQTKCVRAQLVYVAYLSSGSNPGILKFETIIQSDDLSLMLFPSLMAGKCEVVTNAAFWLCSASTPEGFMNASRKSFRCNLGPLICVHTHALESDHSNARSLVPASCCPRGTLQPWLRRPQAECIMPIMLQKEPPSVSYILDSTSSGPF